MILERKLFNLSVNPIRHIIDFIMNNQKSMTMKAMLERLGVAGNVPFEKFRTNTAILLIIFFLMFGAASLYMLLNSAA